MLSHIIVNQNGLEVKRYRNTDFPAMLQQGGRYEKLVAGYLANKGFIAFNRCQWYPPYSKEAKKTQEDITLLHPVTGVTVVIDVKARNSPFNHSEIAVGGIRKYTSRKYVTRVVVMVDDTTGEVRCTDYHPKLWLQGSLGQELSYLVPIDMFYSLETLVENLVKEGYLYPDAKEVEYIVSDIEDDCLLEADWDETIYDQELLDRHEMELEAWHNR